ncbi:MAG: hypothetical protein P1Q69_10570 [Candidatus Thorarchaeota archaeon]|nr:hypothetical protein [Candidatus Thorarchaeota archaeon]
MTLDTTLQDKSKIKEEISHLISTNFSAIGLIAEHLDISEEAVSTLITELVESGTINGGISPDGLRFYRSDVKMPAISEEPVEEIQEDESIKFLIPKAILGTGIALFIAGQILIRIMAEGVPLYNTAGGMVMVGLITILAGLFSFTKFE